MSSPFTPLHTDMRAAIVAKGLDSVKENTVTMQRVKELEKRILYLIQKLIGLRGKNSKTSSNNSLLFYYYGMLKFDNSNDEFVRLKGYNDDFTVNIVDLIYTLSTTQNDDSIDIVFFITKNNNSSDSEEEEEEEKEYLSCEDMLIKMVSSDVLYASSIVLISTPDDSSSRYSQQTNINKLTTKGMNAAETPYIILTQDGVYMYTNKVSKLYYTSADNATKEKATLYSIRVSAQDNTVRSNVYYNPSYLKNISPPNTYLNKFGVYLFSENALVSDALERGKQTASNLYQYLHPISMYTQYTSDYVLINGNGSIGQERYISDGNIWKDSNLTKYIELFGENRIVKNASYGEHVYTVLTSRTDNPHIVYECKNEEDNGNKILYTDVIELIKYYSPNWLDPFDPRSVNVIKYLSPKTLDDLSYRQKVLSGKFSSVNISTTSETEMLIPVIDNEVNRLDEHVGNVQEYHDNITFSFIPSPVVLCSLLSTVSKTSIYENIINDIHDVKTFSIPDDENNIAYVLYPRDVKYVHNADGDDDVEIVYSLCDENNDGKLIFNVIFSGCLVRYYSWEDTVKLEFRYIKIYANGFSFRYYRGYNYIMNTGYDDTGSGSKGFVNGPTSSSLYNWIRETDSNELRLFFNYLNNNMTIAFPSTEGNAVRVYSDRQSIVVGNANAQINSFDLMYGTMNITYNGKEYTNVRVWRPDSDGPVKESIKAHFSVTDDETQKTTTYEFSQCEMNMELDSVIEVSSIKYGEFKTINNIIIDKNATSVSIDDSDIGYTFTGIVYDKNDYPIFMQYTHVDGNIHDCVLLWKSWARNETIDSVIVKDVTSGDVHSFNVNRNALDNDAGYSYSINYVNAVFDGVVDGSDNDSQAKNDEWIQTYMYGKYAYKTVSDSVIDESKVDMLMMFTDSIDASSFTVIKLGNLAFNSWSSPHTIACNRIIKAEINDIYISSEINVTPKQNALYNIQNFNDDVTVINTDYLTYVNKDDKIYAVKTDSGTISVYNGVFDLLNIAEPIMDAEFKIDEFNGYSGKATQTITQTINLTNRHNIMMRGNFLPYASSNTNVSDVIDEETSLIKTDMCHIYYSADNVNYYNVNELSLFNLMEAEFTIKSANIVKRPFSNFTGTFTITVKPFYYSRKLFYVIESKNLVLTIGGAISINTLYPLFLPMHLFSSVWSIGALQIGGKTVGAISIGTAGMYILFTESVSSKIVELNFSLSIPFMNEDTGLSTFIRYSDDAFIISSVASSNIEEAVKGFVYNVPLSVFFARINTSESNIDIAILNNGLRAIKYKPAFSIGNVWGYVQPKINSGWDIVLRHDMIKDRLYELCPYSSLYYRSINGSKLTELNDSVTLYDDDTMLNRLDKNLVFTLSSTMMNESTQISALCMSTSADLRFDSGTVAYSHMNFDYLGSIPGTFYYDTNGTNPYIYVPDTILDTGASFYGNTYVVTNIDDDNVAIENLTNNTITIYHDMLYFTNKCIEYDIQNIFTQSESVKNKFKKYTIKRASTEYYVRVSPIGVKIETTDAEITDGENGSYVYKLVLNALEKIVLTGMKSYYVRVNIGDGHINKVSHMETGWVALRYPTDDMTNKNVKITFVDNKWVGSDYLHPLSEGLYRLHYVKENNIYRLFTEINEEWKFTVRANLDIGLWYQLINGTIFKNVRAIVDSVQNSVRKYSLMFSNDGLFIRFNSALVEDENIIVTIDDLKFNSDECIEYLNTENNIKVETIVNAEHEPISSIGVKINVKKLCDGIMNIEVLDSDNEPTITIMPDSVYSDGFSFRIIHTNEHNPIDDVTNDSTNISLTYNGVVRISE